MMYKKYLRRVLAIILTVVMSAGLVFIGAPENAYAATSKRLVSKVICYTRAGNSWKQTGVIQITYNKKGDPVTIYRNENGQESTNRYVYVYRNGKKAKAKQYEKDGNGLSHLYSIMSYDKKGRVTKNTYVDNLTSKTYKYGKYGYIAKILSDDSTTTLMHYRWNRKKPVILKTENSDYKGVYAQAAFNKYSLIEKTSSKVLSHGDRSFRYAFKNGRVKAIRIDEVKGNQRNHYKYVLKYTNKSTTSARYWAMINYITCRYPVYTGTSWF